MTQTDSMALEYLQEGNDATIREIADVIGRSYNAVQMAMYRLKRLGLVVETGAVERTGNGPRALTWSTTGVTAPIRVAVPDVDTSGMPIVAAALASQTPLERAWGCKA